MAQFDNIKCPTCGREYSGLLTTCPYCELGLDVTSSLPKLTMDDLDTTSAAGQEEESIIVWPDPIEPARPEDPEEPLRSGETPQPYDIEAEGQPRRQSVRSGQTDESVQNVPVARQKKETPEKEKGKTTVSGWVTGIVCIILAIAVIIAVVLLLRSMGILGSSSDTDTAADTATLPISSTPSESETEEEDETTITLETEETEDDTETEETDEEVVWPSDADTEEEETDETESEETTEAEVITEDNEPTTDSSDVDCDSISLNYSDVSLFNIGETVTLTASTVPTDVSAWVTWESSDIAVCTVDADGTVTAVNGGTATITASCGDQQATCIIRCSFEEVDLEELFTISNTDITLFYPGETAQLTISNLDEDSDLVDWESSDPTIATVEDGLVTAVGNGTVTVTATLNSGSVNGQTLTCIVRCSLTDSSSDDDVSVTGSYSLSTYDATMTQDGEYFQLTISSEDSDTIPSHTWTSGDTDVCYVDEFGVVYAVGNGTTTVSTTVDGQYLQCIVRVNISD